MQFHSTRNKKNTVSGAEAVCRGIGGEGGLFVPSEFPQISKTQILEMCGKEYDESAAQIIGWFLPELQNELPDYCTKAYARFDENGVAPLVKLDDNLFVMELWHGPTCAVDDIALTLLPYLWTGAKRQTGNASTTLIPVATSGDTGKAVLESFRDVEGTAVAVFYPDGGVSDLQRLQMITATGKNVCVSAVRGNLDDVQTAVKNASVDAALIAALKEKGIELSRANAIEFGRLVSQIVCYFSAYCDMLDGGQIAYGDKVDFVVPSDAFGDISAGCYARKMGLPVGKLICACSQNKALCDFIKTGTYDVRHEWHKTGNTSKDILLLPDLERLLYDLSGSDELTAQRMAQLNESGVCSLTPQEHKKLREITDAAFATEQEMEDAIADYFDEYGYIIDPHTAVAACVADKCTDGKRPTVILSTASAHKFAARVLRAIGEQPTRDERKNLIKLEDVTALEVPESLINLPRAEKLFNGCIQLDEVYNTLIAFANRVGK